MLKEIETGETALAFAAMQALRPHLRDREEFVQRVDQTLRPAGYRLIGACDQPAETLTLDASAVMGFRCGENLAWGRHLYIDDLSTLPVARGRGYGGALLAWACDEARRLGCGQIHLDSGVGLDRASAHRLYLNSGYRISSHHFSCDEVG